MVLDDKKRLDLLTAPGGAFPLRAHTAGGLTLQVFDRDPRTLRDAFLATRAHGDKLAVVYQDQRWTYDDMWSTMTTLAHVLRTEMGVRKGDRVGIAMRNYPEFIFVFAATQLLGAVAVPFNAWLRAAELGDLIAESRPGILFADPERLAVARTLDLAGSGVERVVGVRCTDLTGDEIAYDSLLADRPAQTEAPDASVEPDDLSTILFTSGTTGKPKAAAHSHLNHSASLLNKYIRAVKVEQDEAGDLVVSPPARSCKLVTFPFFHIAGLNTVYNSLYAGQPLVLMYKWDAAEAVRLVQAEQVNEISGPPFIGATFLAEVGRTGADVSSLRSFGMGGAAAPVTVIDEIRRVLGPGVVPRTGYGMTESTSGVVAISGADFVQRPTSSGRALPTAEIAIVDRRGAHLGVDEVGEVAVRGPQVIRGYLGTADDSFDHGWFRTGDLGRIDADGFVYLVGRLKDVVIRGGENINASEVEGVLASHPDVLEAAVLGAPHPTLGEELVAIVSIVPESVVGVEQLRAHVAASLASFKVPARIAVVRRELPRTASGKIVKRELVGQLDLPTLLDPGA